MILEESNQFDHDLFEIDFLVFSSHKSATQSIKNSLINSGLKCQHCHYLPNINIQEGNFKEYLKRYFTKNQQKLKVITVFREPIERHMSSFFQGYGSRPLRLKEVNTEYETIIYKYSIEQLQNQFLSELYNNSLIGYKESIDSICEELDIISQDLNFDSTRQYGFYESELIRIYFIRFDDLVTNFTNHLSTVAGVQINQTNVNISKNKWYKDIYAEFKSSIVIPSHIISKVYFQKKHLINLFYSNEYEFVLNRTITKYGND